MGSDIVDNLVSLHRKIMAAPRVNTENGPGVKVVLTYQSAGALDTAAIEIDRLRKELAEARNKALDEASRVGYRECAQTRHVSLGNAVSAAILSLKEPK